MQCMSAVCHTLEYCIKLAKGNIKLFSCPGSPIILVFDSIQRYVNPLVRAISKGRMRKTRNSAIADKLRDAFRSQSRAPQMVTLYMLGMVSY